MKMGKHKINLLGAARFCFVGRPKKKFPKKIHELEAILPKGREGEDLEHALRQCPYKDEILNPETGAHYHDSCMYYMTKININSSTEPPHNEGDIISCDDGSPCGTEFRVTRVTPYTIDNAIDIILARWVRKRTDTEWISNRIREKYDTLKRAREANPEAYEEWMAEQLAKPSEVLDAKDRFHFGDHRVDYAGLDYIIRRSILKALSEGKQTIDHKEVKNFSNGFYVNEQVYYIERDVERILEVTGENPDRNVQFGRGKMPLKDYIGLRWGQFNNGTIPNVPKNRGLLPVNWEDNYHAAIEYLFMRDEKFYKAWKQQQIEKMQAG